MEEKCSKCHTAVKSTDYFCYNCGNNLRPSPPSLLLVDQIVLYAKSIILPPFGILWSIKYLKQDSDKSKMVGLTAIILTIISLVISIILFNNFIKSVNTQMNNQINSFNY